MTKYFYDCEEWRPVVGWEGSYEVSNLGNVRSIDRSVLCGDGHTRRFKGSLVKGAADKRMGYRRVVLWDHSRPVGRTVHSLVAEAFIGPPPPGEEVRHRNGCSSDNRALNLRYGTRSDNVRDALEHGTHAQVAKDECPRKHQLMSPNLVTSQLDRGRRDCLACARARSYLHGNPRLDFDLKTLSDRYYAEIMKEAAA